MFWKILDFIRDFEKKYGPFDEVLDVGSLDVNGSVRDALPKDKFYYGIDMRPGKNVDEVLNGHDLVEWFLNPKIGAKVKISGFDLITCCETLEHDDQFWLTVEGMKKILRPGGWLLVTAPGINFFHHDFPSDYYRFTKEAFQDFIFKDFEDVYVEEYFDKSDTIKEKPNNTILGYGRKPL